MPIVAAWDQKKPGRNCHDRDWREKHKHKRGSVHSNSNVYVFPPKIRMLKYGSWSSDEIKIRKMTDSKTKSVSEPG